MITERQEELAALHALGLLEGEERRAFEAELARNPELAALVRALSEASSALALTLPARLPSAALKQRILDAVDQAPVPAARNSAPVVHVSWLRAIPWGLAAALAVAAIWLVSSVRMLDAANESLRTELRLAETAYKSAQNQLAERSLLAEGMITELGTRLKRSEDLARLKVSALASLAGNTKEAQAIAVWDPEQQSGLLTFEGMPVIPESQDYQIWVVDPAYTNPVNGGVFRVDANGRAVLAFKPDQPVNQAAAFAISLEKKGGVPKAEGPIVLMGKVPPSF